MDYTRSINIEPSVGSWYHARAEFYKNRREYDLALDDYSKMITLFPDNSNFYVERARLYVIMNQYDNANNDFEAAINLDTKNTTPYFHRAKMYHIQKEYEKEKADYLKTIEMNDEDPEGYYYLAELNVTQNKIFHATNYFEKAIVRLSADLGYYISNYDEVSTSETLIESYSGAWLYQTIITISDIYLRRAEVYKNVEAIELMCEDYQKACDLGDCEMFNKNCK